MTMIAVCLILFLLAFANFYIYRSLLHPSVAFYLLWAFQVLGILLLYDIFESLSAQILLIVVLGASFFSIGGFLGKMLPMKTYTPSKLFNPSYSFLIFIVLVCFFALLAQISIVFSQEGDSLARKLIGLRVKESIENIDVFGVWKYFSTLAMATLLFICISRNSQVKASHNFTFFVLVVICLCMAFFSTGRTPIIITMMIIILPTIFKYGPVVSPTNVIKTFSLGVVIAVSVFWSIGLVFGKVGETINDVSLGFSTYLFSGLPALDAYINSQSYLSSGASLGEHTFRIFQAIGSRFGLGEPPEPLVQEFVQVPHLTNLYTIFHNPIRDFGLAGVALVSLILGFFHSFLYELFKRNTSDDFIRYIFILSYIPLIQVIFQDTYFSLVSTWVQFYLIGFIFTSKIMSKKGTYS